MKNIIEKTVKYLSESSVPEDEDYISHKKKADDHEEVAYALRSVIRNQHPNPSPVLQAAAKHHSERAEHHRNEAMRIMTR